MYNFSITGLQDTIKEGRIPMKRKQVMRLLAVAMAASLAVTSQGIPAGLTSVFADDAKDQGDLTGGYYVDLSNYIKHTAKCYKGYSDTPAESAVVDVTEANSYYTVKNASGATLSDKYESAAVDDVVKPGEDVEYEAIKVKTQAVLKDDTNHTVYTVVTNKSTVDSIYATQATVDETAGKNQTTAAGIAKAKYVTIGGNQTALNNAAGAYSAGGETGEIVFSTSNATGTIDSSKVYEVTKYVKHTHDNGESCNSNYDDTLRGLPGVITIPDLGSDSDNSLKNAYIALLGDAAGESVTAGEIYVPVTVKEYVPVFNEMGTGDAGITVDGVVYKLASKTTAEEGGSATEVWVDTTTITQPDSTYYKWDDTKKNFVIHTATKVTSSDLNESASHEGDKFDFTTATDDTGKLVIAAVGPTDKDSVLKGTISSENANVVKNNGKYYIDVTKYFVKSIALTNSLESNTRYIATGYDETNIDDALTLTYKDSTDGAAHTATLEKGEVTNSYTGDTEATSADVTGFTLGSKEYYYVADADKDGVIDTNEVKQFSDLKSVDDIKNSGLTKDDAGITIPLTIIKADATIEVTTTSATENNYIDGDGYSNKVFTTADTSANAPTVKATIGAGQTAAPDGYKWVYAWSDKVGETEKNSSAETGALTADDVANTGYTVDQTTIGTHTITLISKLVDSTEGKTTLTTLESAPVTVYIVKQDTDATDKVTLTGEQEYTGEEIGVGTVTGSAEQNVTIKYYNNEAKTSQYELSSTPKDVGEYWYTVSIAPNIPSGYKATEKTGNFKITPKQITATGYKLVDSYTLDAANSNTYTVTLSDVLTPSDAKVVIAANGLEEKADAQFAGKGEGTIFDSVTYNKDAGTITFKLNSLAENSSTVGTLTEDITGTLVSGNYEIAVTFTVDINNKDQSTKEITVVPEASRDKYFAGDNGTDYKPMDIVSGDTTGDESNYTFTYTLQSDDGGEAKTDFPTDAGVYDVVIAYEKTGGAKTITGQAKTTLTIEKKMVTVTIKQGDSDSAVSVAEDAESVPTVTIDVAVAANNGADLSEDAKKALLDAVTYTKKEAAGTTDKASVLSSPGVYTLDIPAASFTNYDLTVTGSKTLTVKTILNLTASDIPGTVGNLPVYAKTLTGKGNTGTPSLPENADVTYSIVGQNGQTVTDGKPMATGAYTITPSIDFSACTDPTGTAALYDVRVTTGTLTVSKATLDITTGAVTYYIGQSAALAYTYEAKNGTTTVVLTDPGVEYTIKNSGNETVKLDDVEENGDYTIDVTITLTGDDADAYEINSTVTKGKLTVMASRTKVTLKATGGSIKVNGSFTPEITVTDNADSTALNSDLAEYKIYLGSVSAENEKTLDYALANAGTYTIVPSIKEANVDFYEATTVQNGTLTVSAASTYNPSSSNNNSNSSTGTTTTYTVKENTDGSKTIVDESGKAVTSSKVTATDGKSYVTDKDGKVLTDSKVTTADGKTYITDEDGVVQTGKVAFKGNQYITGSDGAILTDQVAETPSGNKVYVDENGAIVKNKTVSYNGKKYYATKTGKIATSGFVITAKGNKVYATASGALKTGKVFTVHGKKYYAKASGAIATTGFVKTASGNTVYATKSGAIKVNKAFKASNGKKYVADKNGKIVKGKKITIGSKTYTTNKKGVITKVTTKKK
jgi:hypothetical protein